MVLATVDNPLEVNVDIIENQDSLIEADIQIPKNLMDVQVEFPDEIQDNLEEEEHAPSTRRRKLVISKTSETSEPENDDDLNMEVPTEEEGQMQLVTVPIQQKQAEFGKRILDLKKSLSSGNKEDEDNRLSSLFLKVDECQEEINTKFAKVIELKGDIRDAHENIFKQLTSLNDQQIDITKVLKYSAEKSEKKWDEKASKLVKTLQKSTVEQNKGLLIVIHQQQNQITDLHNELSTLRSENTATSAKVDNIEAKVTKIDGNVELLVDHAKKGEESSHLALSTTGPKFGVIDYFREEQPKYTLNDVPPLIKKQPKKDQVAWVMKANTWMEERAFQNVSNGFVKEYCHENPFKTPMDTTCLVKYKNAKFEGKFQRLEGSYQQKD
nr:hypothetical protein Iba_chr04bCG15370 [Ipomoea batatas]